jgi:hypothetical protein
MMKPASLSIALAACALGAFLPSACPYAADEPAVRGHVQPFVAHYEAYWKGIRVGTSDIKLEPTGEADRLLYTWTITALGIFKLAYHDDLVQRSWLRVIDNHVRPDKYFGKEGSASVELNFDWQDKRATGLSEGKPVDIKLPEGAQDVMSSQVEVMLDLMNNNLPGTFQIIDKDQLKEFNYTQEGSGKIHTDIGDLETVIVTSQRAGNNRLLRMWFAPSLGFVPVQAERSRDGKVEIAMRIRSVDRLVVKPGVSLKSSAE